MAMKKCLIYFMILSLLFTAMPILSFAAGDNLSVVAGNGANAPFSCMMAGKDFARCYPVLPFSVSVHTC